MSIPSRSLGYARVPGSSYEGDDFSLEPLLKSPASGSTDNVFTSSRRADQPGPPQYIDVRKLQTTYNTEERNRQKTEDGEIDNTGHKSTSSGTTKQRGMGSYSGSASTAEDVLGKKGEENSGDSEEYDGRGWGPRPDAGSVVRRSKRQVSVRVYHTLRAEA